MADKLNGLIISEILADNAGNAASDTDGDGNANKADEFVEIQNTSNSPLSLENYELWSEKVGLLYAFDPTDSIGANSTATVVAEYSGTPPAGFYDSGESDNVNWLPDGEGQKFDSIFLVNSLTGDYVVLSYGTPPRTPTLPNNFPGTNQVGNGETINSSSPNGVAFSRDANGNFVESSDPNPGTPGVPCFCPGTLIETDTGPVRVEDLRPGMRLKTAQGAFAPLQAIRQFVLPSRHAMTAPSLRPVTIPAGKFGAQHALTVSPNHRIAITSTKSSLLFGTAEVLIAAKHLLPYGAMRTPYAGGPLHYFHLLLDDHVILIANGTKAESLFLGDMAQAIPNFLSSWDVADGFDITKASHSQSALPILRQYEVDVLFGTEDTLERKSVA